MKKIILILIAFVGSVSIFAQTEELLNEWKSQGFAAAVQGNYQEAIKYYELYKENYGKRYSQEDETYGSIISELAGCYNSLGDYSKAVELGTQAMEIIKATFGENHPDYAKSLSELASYYFSLGDYSKAVEIGTQAMEIIKAIYGENDSYYASSLDNLANYHFYLGDYIKAVELGTQAIELYKANFGENHPDYAISLYKLANYYSGLGDYTLAVEYLTQVVNNFRSVFGDNDSFYTTCLYNLANNYYHLSDYAKAAELATKAIEISRGVLVELPSDYAEFFSNIASYYYSLGDYAKAVEIGTQAMEICKTTLGEDHIDYATSMGNLALFYFSLGNYAKAVEMGTQALEIYREVLGEKHLEYATLLAVIAKYYSHLGDYAKAVELGTQAMEIRREVVGESHPDYARSLNNLASYYSSLGDYAKAVEIGTQAMEIRREVLGESHPDYARSLNNLASYYSSLGDYAKAVEIGTQAMEIFRNSLEENHPDYATSLDNLANYYSHLGDYANAVIMATQAMEIRRETLGENHPYYAKSLGNLANHYFYLGNYAKAVEMGSMAMEISKSALRENHPDYATSLDNLALYYYHLSDYAKALELGTQAVEITRSALGENHPDYAKSLANLAGYYFYLGDYANSKRNFHEITTIFQDNMLQQFANLTASQRALFWDKYSYIFNDVYPFITSLSHATTVPDLYDKSALFAKGLLLSTEIEMNRIIQESGDGEALRMFEELQTNRLQLQKLYETPIAERRIDTDSLAQVVNKQEQALVKRSAVYGDFARKLRTTWQEVQGALRPDEIAIEFLSFKVYGTDSTMVTALTLRKDDKEPKFMPLFEQRQLRSVSDTIYYHCPELTDLVWKPLQQELKGVKCIYFSPAGALHNIGIEYAPGMEGYEMFRLSTTREVITRHNTHPSPPQGREMVTTSTAALFGGIDYNALPEVGTPPSEGTGEALGTGEVSITLHRAFIDSLDIRGAKARFKELPGTKTEVENIKRSFDNKRWHSTLCMGHDATETEVKVISGTKPKILHIATHGFYFTEKQAERQQQMRFLVMGDKRQTAADTEDRALTRSGLLFAGANLALQGKDIPLGADDGILTAQEISRLDLRGLDLVVLSACQTGKGDINQGEGVFGLQRGFKKAGAQTLVMSLWEVADDATQILMTAFYDNLLKGESKREAFMHAQQYLRQCDNGIFNRPEYWAAFILLD